MVYFITLPMLNSEICQNILYHLYIFFLSIPEYTHICSTNVAKALKIQKLKTTAKTNSFICMGIHIINNVLARSFPTKEKLEKTPPKAYGKASEILGINARWMCHLTNRQQHKQLGKDMRPKRISRFDLSPSLSCPLTPVLFHSQTSRKTAATAKISFRLRF